MTDIKIAPSLLAADFSCLATSIRQAEDGGADLLHVDVMDGHFVPNITMGPVVVRALRPLTRLPLDVHLMIEHPDRYLDAFIEAGADYVTVHVEACVHLHRTVQVLKERGVGAGVALNPHTPLSSLEEILPEVDLVLIMSVNPGFGGQAFIPQMFDKLRRLRALLRRRGLDHVEVEVDGGVKPDNIRDVAEAGAQVLVSGSGVFGTPDPARTLRMMRACLIPEAVA